MRYVGTVVKEVVIEESAVVEIVKSGVDDVQVPKGDAIICRLVPAGELDVADRAGYLDAAVQSCISSQDLVEDLAGVWVEYVYEDSNDGTTYTMPMRQFLVLAGVSQGSLKRA